MPEANDNDIGKLLELVRVLSVPDSRPRVLRTMFRRKRPKPRPIILIDAPAPGQLLTGIYNWLGGSDGGQESPHADHKRATPRARVDLSDLPQDALAPAATGAEEIQSHYLPILHSLVLGFSKDNTAMGPIRFPRYRTADWLTRQRLISEDTDDAVELRARLPKLLRSGSPAAASAGDASEAAAGDIVARVVFGVFALWPVLRVWLWVSGRIPGMSKVTRWFMHQRYLAPELSDSFLGFATRLTASGRSHENEEQIAKLLVHAFLEDLRDAYRRYIWRPSGWRRTAYPVALLVGPDAQDGAGARLLARINDIRNETGLFDPLVVLACLVPAPAVPPSDAPPSDAPPPAAPPSDLARIGDLANLDTLENFTGRSEPGQDPLQCWLDEIDTRRTNRLPDAWYLPLRVRVPDPLGNTVRNAENAHLAVPPAPPLAARRWFVAMSVIVPIVLLAAATLVAVPALRGVPCSHWPWTSGISVSMKNGECIGYSDSSGQAFSENAELLAMQDRVFGLNRAAEKAHEEEPARPLVTLIYFAGLTHDEASSRYPLAQAEELAGVAVQQQLWLDNRGPGTPLLRVVIANGGTGMSSAVSVVEDHLSELIEADPGVLGVIGMDRSTATTRDAITRLGQLGVPVLATTLSADELFAASPLYFQAVPSNKRQAALIADYIAGARYPAGNAKAGQLFYAQVGLYYSKNVGDIFVANLIQDLTEELQARGIPFEEYSWTENQPSVDVPVACRDDDSQRTLLFYAARNEDFTNFARKAAANCDAGRGPVILGNDTLTRVLADPDVVKSIPPWSTVRYVAYAASVMLGGAECREGTVAGDSRPTGGHVQLCEGLPALIEYLRERSEIDDSYTPNWPGDRLALGFDVVGAFQQAVIDSRRDDRPPNRAAVAAQLLQTTYRGATGTLDFAYSRVVEQAPIAVLATDLSGPEPATRCLVMYPGAETMDKPGDRVGGNGCPLEPGVDTGTDPASEFEDWVGRPGN